MRYCGPGLGATPYERSGVFDVVTAMAPTGDLSPAIDPHACDDLAAADTAKIPEKSTHAVTRRRPPGPRPVLVRTALRSEEEREMVERGLVERADAVTRL